MRKGIRTLLCLGLIMGACGVQAPRIESTPPNLVFLLLDNVGQEWFGCYGSEEHATPEIDSLASQGVRVEHVYTHPVCGPSRVILLTGRYPFRTGWTMHHDAALYGGGGLDPGRETTIARILRETGYATAVVGKWQVNNLYDEPDVLGQHGFKEHLIWPGSMDRDRVAGVRYQQFLEHVRQGRSEELTRLLRDIESRYWDPVLIRNGKRETWPKRFGPDVLQEFALEFIRRHREEPFFLFYPMVLAHGPTFTEPTVHTPLNHGRDLTPHQRFADMVRYADRQLGEVVRTLEELGLRERTILFVASDNGTEGAFSARRNGREVRGGLHKLTEAGRVAMVVNGPGRVRGGRIADLADFSDVFPTMCELAGTGVQDHLLLDGRSLAPFLTGRSETTSRNWIFNQYHTRRVVRNRRYKLYSTGEFYDILDDPEESRDLTAAGSVTASEARESLQGVLDALPTDEALPFPFRSISAFRLREAGLMK